MKIFKKITGRAVKDFTRDRDFKYKVGAKLTKLGAEGTEHPLLCKHEHCKWWQVKHLLVSKVAKERTINKLPRCKSCGRPNKKQEEEEE